MSLFLEIAAVVLNLIYLILLIRENIWCWFFGIAGSLVSIYLFYSIALYSEAILYIYYVIIGVYGYLVWSKERDGQLHIQRINLLQHTLIIIGGCITTAVVGYLFDTYTDASKPYLDAFTTIFSFIASFMEARKIISAWIFWIVINLTTVVLYLQENLPIYLGLTIVYLVFSVVGYREWSKKV